MTMVWMNNRVNDDAMTIMTTAVDEDKNDMACYTTTITPACSPAHKGGPLPHTR